MDRELAERVADTIFDDLRDRKFLKWLLAEDADRMGPILHDSHGAPLMPISEAVQDEMRDEWIAALVKL